MKTKIKSFNLLLVILFFGYQDLLAHDEFTKVVKKEFTVDPGTQFTVENKFGKVHCNNWDKNVISIEVTLRVEASDERAAEKIMDKISILLNGSASEVTARTIISEGGFKGRNRVNIDYMINMPVNLNLDITNKFGDIYFNEISGKGRIDLGYGNLEANKMGNSDNLIEIKFGRGNVKYIQGAVLNLKYSEFRLDYAGSLRLDSKYSDLWANKVVALNMNFEGGKINMENSSSFDSRSKFSDIYITRLEKSLNLDIQYGKCDIKDMPSDFTSINIKNKYSDVKVGIASNAGYSLEADLRFCELIFPESDADLSQRITTNTSKYFKGTIGKAGASMSKVTVKSEFGNVTLK
ncbi:MAG: hypothetical protein WCL00_06325 [Bacteroidota bacterium]